MTITLSESILERLEWRIAHRLAGLEDPPDVTIWKFSANGPSQPVYAPLLPSGRELLRFCIAENRSLNDHVLRIAREAAIADLLVSTEAEELTEK